MRDLFPYFNGDYLEISRTTHEYLKFVFPEVDLPSSYRDADAWLWHMPPRRRPKNVKRFLVNWMRKEKRKVERQPSERERDLQVAIHAGEYRY